MLSSKKPNFQHPVAKLSQNPSAAIANSICCIQVPEHHNRASNLQLQLCQWKRPTIDLIQVLHRIVEQGVIFSRLLRGRNKVHTVKDLSRARKLGKNRLIESINLLVNAGKDDALREVLIRMTGSVNVAGIISMFTMANLQLPSCKVGLFFNMSVKAHVLMKLKNCDIPPQDGFSYAGTDNLRSGTLDNDRQDLLKVATKYHGKTTKGLVRITQIPKRAINCLHDVTMLHGCLIPNDQVSLTDQSSQRGVFGDEAE